MYPSTESSERYKKENSSYSVLFQNIQLSKLNWEKNVYSSKSMSADCNFNLIAETRMLFL